MSHYGRLAGKTAIITGAASGIGRAIALAYAQEGANVVVADLRENSTAPEEKEVTTMDLVKKHAPDRECLFIKCDVSKAADVDAVVAKTVEKFGRLDIMVNNAGISTETQHSVPIYEYREDHLLDKTLDINVKGVFYGVRAASAQMVKQEPFVPPHLRTSGSTSAPAEPSTSAIPGITRTPGGDKGWIVNLASIFALVGCPNAISYVTSKHAVLGITRTAALDCAPHRIHVNAVCPGFLATSLTASQIQQKPENYGQAAAMHPFGGGGIGAPRDVCGVAVFLASEDARWMTGAAVTVDGGYTAM